MGRTVQGSDHPDTLGAINNLGALFYAQQRFLEADALFREGMERYRRLLGPEIAETQVAISNAGESARELGQLEEAHKLGSEAVGLSRQSVLNGHWYQGVFLREHATTLVTMGRYTDAEEEMLEGLQAALLRMELLAQSVYMGQHLVLLDGLPGPVAVLLEGPVGFWLLLADASLFGS